MAAVGTVVGRAGLLPGCLYGLAAITVDTLVGGASPQPSRLGSLAVIAVGEFVDRARPQLSWLRVQAASGVCMCASDWPPEAQDTLDGHQC